MGIKARIKEREKQNTLYFTITGPILGAINLLKAHQYDDGLNLATVYRTLDWGWSTYRYLYEDLNQRNRNKIDGLLDALDQRIKEFDWDSAKHTKDGWTVAMEYYLDVD